MSPSKKEIQKVDLIQFAKSLGTGAGGDWPEATKTGLARAYELTRKEATTIVLLYADAPPHTAMNGSVKNKNSCLGPELKALNAKRSYGGYGQYFVDWVSASKRISGQVGDKKAQVFCILQRGMRPNDSDYYNYLSTVTNGSCFFVKDPRPATISKVTVEVLLAWMGTEKAGTAETANIPAYFSQYKSVDGIDSLKSETDIAADKFFHATSAPKISHGGTSWNVNQILATSKLLKDQLPKKTTPVQDFAKRYNLDEDYKKLAIDIVRKIIGYDVVAISINPVFGSLWRAICNDRNNETRDEIITAFGLQVDRITDPAEKARMKLWLEESYDYTAEVTEAIESVPEDQRFPCVCLDPTQVFTIDAGPDDEDEGNKPITDFRRDELLEIGRSCDYKILRRLGRVLTRLTYINSAAEMPAHIAAASETEIPRIPMALARSEYKRKFWKILLHIVVPGTMLSARPAALLAALAIRLGVHPLLEAADSEMLLWRDRWNNIEIPETWNMSCLGLLMDADKAYRTRKGEESNEEVSEFMPKDCGERPVKRPRLDMTFLTSPKAKTLLKPEDRALFDRLVSYKMLELNLTTSLMPQIAWTPKKTKVAMGPTIICRSCEYPRSVTIMGADGKCGHCLCEFATPEERQNAVTAHVTKKDNENTLGTWVECNLRICRAQYVVYRVEALNVKPKCHYCRHDMKAPVVECCECLNRVIYPEEYRSGDMKDFKCYACTSGRKTTVAEETTARSLEVENSTDWLLRNDGKIAEPFKGRSLFHTISTAGTEDFCKKVELFPGLADRELRLQGKMVRNVPALTEELKSWVSRRRTESGTCSLCFSSMRKSELLLACGRSGCPQRICKGCLEGWYGLNAPGRIINTAALSCPFCRRNPTAKTLAKYGMGIHAVGNLSSAVAEKGEWIHAWCTGCGYAKQYMERVCAAGAPEELKDWTCEACQVSEVAENKRMKKCPGCGVMTEKTSGCDHITCSVPGCNTHWCFYCGKGCDFSEIYDHISKEHGGYYGGVAAEDADWDESEEE